MLWILLTPREIELTMRPLGLDDARNDNTAILREVQGRLDQITGDLEITETQFVRLKAAAGNWRGGYENRLKALLAAADRTIIGQRVGDR